MFLFSCFLFFNGCEDSPSVEPDAEKQQKPLCNTYQEDTQRTNACYDSKECLIGKWRFKGFIETDSCIVEIPDSIYYDWPPFQRWEELDSTNTPWIEFFENDSLAGRGIHNKIIVIEMTAYKIDENNDIHWNFGRMDAQGPQWSERFLDSLHASNKFVSFTDTLFLYNKNAKMLFIKEEYQ